MKRLVVLIVVLTSALPILPGRAAPARSRGRITRDSLPQLTHVAHDALFRSLQSGAISEAHYALERARSVFQLGAVRSEFGTVARPDGRAATFLLRDLALRLDSLSVDDRAAAEAILARPTQGAADPDGTGYSVPEAEPVCSTHVCVHYVATSNDRATPTFVNQVSSVMEYVWTTEIDTFGWRAPVPDAGSNPNGGGGKFDVYLANLGAQGVYGFCTPDPGQTTYAEAAYCVLDNDFEEFPLGPTESLEVTAAHEFNHAIQFAYDVTEDLWLLEATAVFMEDEVYDDVNDNYQYLVTGPYGRPQTPADSFINFNDPGPDGGYQYGTFIWMRYLSERFATRDAVRRIWEKVDAKTAGGSSLYSLEGITAMLAEHGSDFASSFADFAAKNAKPSAFYEEGAAYESEVAPPRSVRRTLANSAPTTTGTFSNVDHLSSRYVSFRPGSDVAAGDQITIAVNLDDTTGTQRATVVNLVGDSATYTPIPLDGNGRGNVTVQFGGQSEVVLAMTNASDRITNCRGSRPGGFSCGGSPLDDNRGYSYSGAIGTTPVDPGEPGTGNGTTEIVTHVSDGPDPFHPGGGRKVKIKFTVLVDCLTSIKLYRPNGNLLGTLVLRQRITPGLWVVNWLGNDTRGRLVPRGKYTYKIKSTDSSGAKDTATGTIRIQR